MLALLPGDPVSSFGAYTTSWATLGSRAGGAGVFGGALPGQRPGIQGPAGCSLRELSAGLA